jgi:hypothetical protein
MCRTIQLNVLLYGHVPRVSDFGLVKDLTSDSNTLRKTRPARARRLEVHDEVGLREMTGSGLRRPGHRRRAADGEAPTGSIVRRSAQS